MVKPLFAVSDTHPDYNTNPAQLLEFLRYAACESRGLVMVGDWFGDLLVKRWETVSSDERVKVYVAELLRTADRIPVWCIRGNHECGGAREEAQMRAWVHRPNIYHVDEWLNGNDVGLYGWQFTHGHQADKFDPTTALWGCLLGFGNSIHEGLTEKVALWILKTVLGKKKLPNPGDAIRALTVECEDAPVTAWAGGKIADMQHYIHILHVAWLRKQENIRTLVCGHTHKPERVDLGGGKTYYNTGAIDGWTSSYLKVFSPTDAQLVEF